MFMPKFIVNMYCFNYFSFIMDKISLSLEWIYFIVFAISNNMLLFIYQFIIYIKYYYFEILIYSHMRQHFMHNIEIHRYCDTTFVKLCIRNSSLL